MYVKIYLLSPSIFSHHEDGLEFQIHPGFNLMHGYKVELSEQLHRVFDPGKELIHFCHSQTGVLGGG